MHFIYEFYFTIIVLQSYDIIIYNHCEQWLL